MYTEDDEKVEVKTDNSNVQEADFYTSFNDIEKETKKPKKEKKKATPKPKVEKAPVKEEEDYQDFYGSNNEEEVTVDNGNRNIRKLIIAGIIILLLIILIVIIFIIKGNTVKGDIVLEQNDISLEAGKKEYISYKVVDTESSVTSKFVSSDDAVAMVDDNGEITAINEGEATITVYYTIDGVTREKKCVVKVTGTSGINQDITLNLKLTNGKDNVWTNKDVTITPEASSIYGISSIKYAVNCTDKCEYTDITGNKITISSVGVTKVKIVATDKKKRELTKEVTIKIDKEAPSVTLNSDTNITSNKDVEVCATCSDSLSGCKQAKVCKKYTTTTKNQTITVEDNAGNKSTTKTFNVTINKTTNPCYLTVSSDGKITATLREEATYYGFNSSYSGTNTLSSNATFPKYENAVKIFYYYVKTKTGATGKCSITVLQQCTCSKASCCTYKSQ